MLEPIGDLARDEVELVVAAERPGPAHVLQVDLQRGLAVGDRLRDRLLGDGPRRKHAPARPVLRDLVLDTVDRDELAGPQMAPHVLRQGVRLVVAGEDREGEVVHGVGHAHFRAVAEHRADVVRFDQLRRAPGALEEAPERPLDPARGRGELRPLALEVEDEVGAVVWNGAVGIHEAPLFKVRPLGVHEPRVGSKRRHDALWGRVLKARQLRLNPLDREPFGDAAREPFRHEKARAVIPQIDDPREVLQFPKIRQPSDDARDVLTREHPRAPLGGLEGAHLVALQRVGPQVPLERGRPPGGVVGPHKTPAEPRQAAGGRGGQRPLDVALRRPRVAPEAPAARLLARSRDRRWRGRGRRASRWRRGPRPPAAEEEAEGSRQDPGGRPPGRLLAPLLLAHLAQVLAAHLVGAGRGLRRLVHLDLGLLLGHARPLGLRLHLGGLVYGRRLLLVLVEVQLPVQLRLLNEQGLQPGFVLEGLLDLLLEGGEVLLQPGDDALRLRRLALDVEDHGLDRLDRARRVLLVDRRQVAPPALDVERGQDALALEADNGEVEAEILARLDPADLAGARRDDGGERLTGLLAGALAREDSAADRHGELRPFRLHALPVGEVLLVLPLGRAVELDVPREVGQLHRQTDDGALVVGAEVVELANLGVGLDLLHDRGVAGGDRLHLGVGERDLVHVLDSAHRHLAPHELGDHPGLPLQPLPHVGVEGALGDVAEDLDLLVAVALPEDAPVALFDVGRAPRGVEVVLGDEEPLDVHPDAHLGGRTHQDAHAPGVHGVEELLLGQVTLRVVDEADLLGWHAAADQLGLHVVVGAEAALAGRAGAREVDEDELREALGARGVPAREDFLHGEVDLALRDVRGLRIDEPHVEGGLPAVRGDRQHVVHVRRHPALADPLGPGEQGLDEGRQLRARRRGDRPRLAPGRRRDGQLEHLRRLDVGDQPEHGGELRHVRELAEPGVDAVARAGRRRLERRHRLAEVGGPGVELRQPALAQERHLEVALHREHLGQRVADRGARGEDDAPPHLLEVLGLDEHVEGPVALRVRQPGDPRHLRVEVEVLEGVGLVHEEGVHPELLEGERHVLRLAVGPLLQLRLEAALGLLDLLHHARVGALGLELGQVGRQLVELFLEVAREGPVGDGQELEGLVGDDDGVVGARGDPAHDPLALALGEVLLAGDEQVRRRVEPQELGAPLLDEVVRHHDHRLLGQADPLELHGRRRHLEGLARADDVGQERGRALERPPDGVLLVGLESDRRVRPGQRQVLAVGLPGAQVVHLLVVGADQARGALGVLPDPLLELLLDFLLLLAGGRGLRHVEDAPLALGIPDHVVDGGDAEVEGVGDQLVGVVARGPPGLRVRGEVRAPARLYGPRGDGLDVAHAEVPGVGVEELGDEVLDVPGGHPGGAQPHVDLAGLEVPGLHEPEGRGVALEGRVALRGGLGGGELRPDVAREVDVGRLPRAALGVPVDEVAEVRLELRRGLARQLLHAEPVDPAALVERHGERLDGRFSALDGTVALERALGEHVGLGRALRLRVVVLQREQERVVGVTRERGVVVSARERPVAPGEGVVGRVQGRAGGRDLRLRPVLELRAEDLAHGVAHAEHPLDPRRGARGDLGRDEALALAHREQVAPDGVAALLHRAGAGHLHGRHALGRGGRGGRHRVRWQARDRRVEGLARERALEGRHPVPVHRAGQGHLAEHLLGVAAVILVDLNLLATLAADRREVLPGFALGLDLGRPLLEEEDVRRHLRAGDPLERGVRQADGAEQVGAGGEVAAHAAVHLVHRVGGGDERDHAARAHLVERLGEEIVVDRAEQAWGLPVARVVDTVVAEGHVADREVEVVVGQADGLEALDVDGGLGIEELGEAPGDAVELDPGAVAPRQEGLGHQAEEVAGAQGGLEDRAAGLEAEPLDCAPHRLHHERSRVVGVRRGGARGGELLGREGGLELRAHALPLAGDVGGGEGLRHPAPADVAGEDRLLVGRGRAAGLLDLLEEAEGL